MWKKGLVFRAWICVLALAVPAGAQGGDPHPGPPPPPALRRAVSSIVRDQRAIWTSPARLDRRHAAFWLPAAAATAGLVLSDRSTYRETRQAFSISTRDGLNNFSRFASPVYLFALSGGLWLLGRGISEERLERTGVLATRALVSDLIVVGALKVVTGRQRPPTGSFGGPADGFDGSEQRSFPSGHASAAWAVAAVVSSRHRQRWVPFVFYGFAGALSLARVAGGRHFYGDVVAGGLIGYGVGKMVARSANGRP